MAIYATLAMKGFFPEEELAHLQPGQWPPRRAPAGQPAAGRRSRHRLAGPRPADRHRHGGCPAASRTRTYRVFALLSDGENNEGSVWEAAMFASAQKLENLCVIVDYNKWQATARSNETLMLAPLADKWRGLRLGRA